MHTKNSRLRCRPYLCPSVSKSLATLEADFIVFMELISPRGGLETQELGIL